MGILQTLIKRKINGETNLILTNVINTKNVNVTYSRLMLNKQYVNVYVTLNKVLKQEL